MLGKTAAVTLVARGGEVWHLFTFGLSSDVLMEGLVSVLIHQSEWPCWVFPFREINYVQKDTAQTRL